MNITFPARLICLAVIAACTASVSAAPVLLDFETAETGSNLGTSPLMTTAGTVTLSGAGASISAGPTGAGLRHSEDRQQGDFARLDFSFEVTSITFDFSGVGLGDFLAQALAADGSVIDIFQFSGTTCSLNISTGCFDGKGTLSGSAIRAFRFQDSAPSYVDSFVDNLSLSTAPAPVPEPATMALVGLALAGMSVVRRRKPV